MSRIKTGSRLLVAGRGGGGWGMGKRGNLERLLRAFITSFYNDENVLKVDTGDGCTTGKYTKIIKLYTSEG